MVNSAGATVSNGLTFADGDGIDAATYHLLGGVHSFANGLEIRNNASLTGCGTITGNVVVDAGGTVLADCGTTLNFSGIVTNTGTMIATGGTVLKFYGPVVNSGLIDATGGDVRFFSTINNGGQIVTPTNSWTDGTGKWETSNNWSHATAPSSSDAANLITNAGNNTVTIDGVTASNYPGTMSIRNLTVSAPNGATNTLFLNNAGTLTPLWILGNLMLKTNGAMVVNNSAVQAANSINLGDPSSGNSLVISNGGSVFTTNLAVGFGWATSNNLVQLDNGSLIVTNGSGTARVLVNGGSLLLGAGTFKADHLVVTNAGAVQYTQTYRVDNATVTVAGGNVQAGSNFLAGSSVNSTGIVTVTDGGLLTVTNGVVGIGNDGSTTNGTGVAQMTVSNGTVLASTILLGSSAGGRGDLIIQSNGVVLFGNCPGGTNCSLIANDITINGGALFITNGTSFCGNNNPGAMTVSNGSAYCLLLYAGYNNAGTLTMVSGQVNVLAGLTVGGVGIATATGAVWITGSGELDSTNDGVISVVGNDGVGRLTVSNGLVRLASLWVANPNSGTVTLAGGTLVTGNLRLTRLAGRFVLNTGTLATQATSVTNGLPFTVGDGINPATMTLQGGVHSFSNGLVISANASLTGCGTVNGSVTVNSGGSVLADCGGTLTFTGIVTNNGTMRALNGSVLESYGPFANNGVLDLMTGTTNFHGTFVNNGVVADASCFRILSIARQGNDVLLTWSAVGGRSCVVQTNSGTAAGDYTGNFTDFCEPIPVVGCGVCTTDYRDVGGATNSPARYYRVRLVP